MFLQLFASLQLASVGDLQDHGSGPEAVPREYTPSPFRGQPPAESEPPSLYVGRGRERNTGPLSKV